MDWAMTDTTPDDVKWAAPDSTVPYTSIFGAGDAVVEKVESPPPVSATSRRSRSPIESPEGSEGAEAYSFGTESGSDHDFSIQRPNRFLGPPSTYRRWTAPERAILDVLDVEQANNLGLHVYRVEKLKRFLIRQARKAAERRPQLGAGESTGDPSLEARFLPGSEPSYSQTELPPSTQAPKPLGSSDPLEGIWLPPDTWTTWPLKLDQVPREEDTFEVHRRVDQGGLRPPPREDDTAPSTWMRELLTSLIMRYARHLVLEREGRRPEPRTTVDDEEEVSINKTGENSNRYHPVLLEDEDVGHPIVDPAIRTLLSRLDRLLVYSLPDECRGSLGARLDRPVFSSDLDRNRSLKETAEEGDSSREESLPGVRERDTEVETGTSASTDHAPVRKKRGRPPIYRPSPPPDSRSSPGSESATPATLRRRKGRPRSVVRLPGESYYMARKRRNSGASAHVEHGESRDASRDTAPPSKRIRTERGRSRGRRRGSTSLPHRSQTRDSSEGPGPGEEQKPKAMDWRSVLGRAALLGWDTSVLDRASQRCVEMLDEPIAFDVTSSGSALEQPLHVPFSSSENHSLQSITRAAASRQTTFTPYWDGADLSCPMPTCPRHFRAFANLRRLASHCRRVHKFELQGEVAARKLEARRNKNAAKGKPKSRPASVPRWPFTDDRFSFGDDVFIGGARNDGFLQTIPRERGWNTKPIRTIDRNRTDDKLGTRDQTEDAMDVANDTDMGDTTVAGAAQSAPLGDD